jgi:hypothetical protein
VAQCQKLPPATAGFVSVRAPDGSLGALRPLGADLLAGPVRLADGSFAAVLGTPVRRGECFPAENVELATLSAAGAVTARAPLAARAVLSRVEVATGPGGELLVAWLDSTTPSTGGERESVHLSVRGATGALAPPVTVAQAPGLHPDDGGISDFALAADPGGGALLAWAVRGRVRAVDIAAGATIGPAIELGPADSVSAVQAGVARDGRAVVAWSTQDGRARPRRPLRVRAAIRPRAGAAFGAARTLDRGHALAVPPDAMSLALAGNGRALLAWADVVGSGPRRDLLYATVTGRTGGFRPVRRIARLVADPVAYVEDTAFTPAGTALVAYFSHGRLLLVRRAASAQRFGTPAAFARGHSLHLTPGPDGHLLASWVTYPRHGDGQVHLARLAGG